MTSTSMNRPITDKFLGALSHNMRRYFIFTGRTGPRNYWIFIGVVLVLIAVFQVWGLFLPGLLNLKDGDGDLSMAIFERYLFGNNDMTPLTPGDFLVLAFPAVPVLFFALPTLTATVRRMRDAGKSWLHLLWFAAAILATAGLVFLAFQFSGLAAILAGHAANNTDSDNIGKGIAGLVVWFFWQAVFALIDLLLAVPVLLLYIRAVIPLFRGSHDDSFPIVNQIREPHNPQIGAKIADL